MCGIQFAYISCCYAGQTSGKLSDCHEQPLSEKYAYNLNTLVNRSIATVLGIRKTNPLKTSPDYSRAWVYGKIHVIAKSIGLHQLKGHHFTNSIQAS